MKPIETEIIDAATQHCKQFDSDYQDQSYSDFYEGAEWAISQMQPEWVAVTEGYPEIGAQCYFYRRGTSDFVFTGQYNGVDQWGENYFKEEGIPAYYRDVTHYLVFSKPQPPTDKP